MNVIQQLKDKLGVNNIFPVTWTKAVYDETTGDRLDNTIAEINNKITNYSYEERIVGKWVDGKTLYQKSYKIPVNALVNNATIVSIDSTVIDSIINIEATIYKDGTTQYSLPMVSTTAVTSLYRVYNRGIVVVTSDNWSGYEGVITLKYTKR